MQSDNDLADSNEGNDTVTECQFSDDENHPNFNLRDIIKRVKNGETVPPIIKPKGTGGRSFIIRKCMGLKDERQWYNDILV